MNHTIGWSLGLCCGLPLLLVLAGGGAAGYWSQPATMGCLGVIAVLAGYAGWGYLTRRDEVDGRADEPDELTLED